MTLCACFTKTQNELYFNAPKRSVLIFLSSLFRTLRQKCSGISKYCRIVAYSEISAEHSLLELTR